MKKNNILYLIMPCYNEEEMISITLSKSTKKMNELIDKKIISSKSRIVFVDDGSVDNTWNIIKKYSKKNKIIDGIKLSRNKGHQNALLAGIEYSVDKCDFTITIDSDLQQDINALDIFIEKYNEGNEIVYGIRESRKTDSIIYKFASHMYYKILKCFNKDMIYNHADYRLISNKVAKELIKFKEHDLYLRGIFPNIGFKSSYVYYNEFIREKGKPSYNLKKRLQLAYDGIISSSKALLKIISMFFYITFISSIGLLITRLFVNNNIYVYLSLICLCTSLIILSIRIVTSYMIRIYDEVKNRPRYIIEEIIKQQK